MQSVIDTGGWKYTVCCEWKLYDRFQGIKFYIKFANIWNIDNLILNFSTNYGINVSLIFLTQGDKSKGLWLDYVLVIAKPDFVDSAISEVNRVDYTREFIDKCAVNHYYISANETGKLTGKSKYSN